MGFFSAIKEFFKFKKDLKNIMKEAKEKSFRYLEMTTDELALLSDDDLFEAVVLRTEKKVDGFEALEDGISSLNQSQKIFYSLNWFEMEVNNGGLCQFFVNSSRVVAPLISEYMSVVGAQDHKKLYDGFIQKNNIDLNDLSFFDIEEVDEFEKKAQRYPFDEYDDAFCDTEPLETNLKYYIRKHLADF